LATDEKLLSIISQLWRVGFHTGQGEGSESPETDFRHHPFGSFNPKHAYAYIDRVGYRIPTHLSERIGQEIAQGSEEHCRMKRPRPLQRSLTPHLDCCPHSMNNVENVSKWRPLQSFVSLTDNLQANTGGFEAALGFHRQFAKWSQQRPPSLQGKKDNPVIIQGNGLCKGAFTPIRPVEDREVIQQIQHVPCRAGSFVVWDNRIPHANARRNEDLNQVRQVVYVSFLPADVGVNQRYAQRQLQDYINGFIPTDQWVEFDKVAGHPKDPDKDELYNFSPLGRTLMGIDPW